MFIQGTVFDNVNPQLPGAVRIHWQGIGQDRGYTVVFGRVGEDIGWHLVDSIGGTLSADITIDGTQSTTSLTPRLTYPKTWWMGVNWSAFPDSIENPLSWTLVRSALSNWYPREWQFQWLETQGADELSDVKMHWHGDAWFDGTGTGRGALRKNEDEEEEEEEQEEEQQEEEEEDEHGEEEEQEEEEPTTFAVCTYTWNGLRHQGKGTAPAGEYGIDGETAVRNVGYWDEENQVYRLKWGDDYETTPVSMTQLGILRGGATPPTSWTFTGADWTDPDPFDWRYWHCIRCALIERESVIESVIDGTRYLGSLIGGEDALWSISPLSPLNLECVQTMRSLIIALSMEYIDLDRVMEMFQDDDEPLLTKANTHILLDGYEYIVGGWEQGDPISAGKFKGFLKDAYAVLRKMTLLPTPLTVFNAYKTGWMSGAGWSYEEDGESFADAWDEAIDDYETMGEQVGRHWVYWTRSRSGSSIKNGWTSGISGRSGAEEWNGETNWEVQFGNWQVAIFAIPRPLTSVLDGLPMSAPKCLYVKNSKKLDYEIGDTLYGGVVKANQYYSGITTEGLQSGIVNFPLVLEEEPGGAIQPPTPSEPNQMEWTVWGNSTSWNLYTSWALCFRFNGDEHGEG